MTLNDIVRFLDSLIGDINDPDTRRRLLEFFVNKIYVYPEKMVLTFYYSDDQRELPYEDTIEFIENRERLIELIDNPPFQCDVPSCVPVTPCSDKEETPDFFP